eukprot:TRINITY_DN15507_c0_g1_i4.p1 TRINITY_DN15507_c0_g1~~TRINITY_DN15507_c0_g1_i4.p1  ORF type:complete len:275 (+),score=37.63 TRINITY_DN15507_c0_g1_i4:111-827(+)
MSSARAAKFNVIMDVDTGVDDAMALLLATRCPDINLLAVTCVQGNTPVHRAVKNTMKVLDAAGARPDLPVAEGFQQALLEPLHHCPSIHGEDGVGDLQPPLQESSRTPHTEHAVQLLLKTLHAAPKEPGLVVIALGPLTNIAVAIRTDPAVWHKKCSKLVWMGGAVSIGGNSTAWGEANAFCDPEAAQIVLSSGLNIMMYPWDVFTKPAFSKQELEEMGLPDVDAESEKKLRNGFARC